MEIVHDLQSILAQENALVFPHFDADRAWQLGAYLHEVAKARGLALAIDIRTFGQPLFFSMLAGATPDNVDGRVARATRWRISGAVPMRSACACSRRAAR